MQLRFATSSFISSYHASISFPPWKLLSRPSKSSRFSLEILLVIMGIELWKQLLVVFVAASNSSREFGHRRGTGIRSSLCNREFKTIAIRNGVQQLERLKVTFALRKGRAELLIRMNIEHLNARP
ncbi:hypothetical protein ABKN59_001538 [Abortiporus biennis]